MSKIDEFFEQELKKEEDEGIEVLGRLRKLEEGDTEINFNELAEIRDKPYKFPDKVTREAKLVMRKIYIWKSEQKSGHPLIIPVSVHRDIRELRLKHGKKMISAIIKARGEGIKRRYKVVPMLQE